MKKYPTVFNDAALAEYLHDRQRAADIDDRMAQILLQLHTTDGGLYQTAISHLTECQAWIRDTP